MYPKAQLESMSPNELEELAKRAGLARVSSLTKEELIEQLLAVREENSEFISDETEDSAFISDDEEASGFLTQEEQSAFISEEGSAFISESEGSGFISSNEASGFMTDDPPTGKSKKHQLGPGDSVKLNDKEYLIQEIISQSSGEAVIYKIQAQDATTLALKLYHEARNIKREPNGEALERIREITHKDILKLHDFGTKDQKYLGKYCFEISTFAKGGDLLSVADFRATYTYPFILQEVVPQIFHGIKLLHEQKIYHCDLKPQNVFFLDEAQKDLVIGDYGSAKTFAAGSNLEHKRYSEVIGTKTYLAPEQANGIISEKNDYYAFGMILLHLLYPEAIAQADNPQRIDREKLHKIKEHQYEQVRIYGFLPEYRRLNQLIEGLTLYNHKYRWGRQEVEGWLRGEHVSVSYHAQSVIKPIKLGWTTIRMPDDLIQAVEQHSPKQWYSDLIQDEINFRDLLIWLNNLQDAQQRKAFQKMVLYYQDEKASGVKREERIPYLKEAIIRFFDPYRLLKLGADEFDFIGCENIYTEIGRFFDTLDQFWKKTELNRIRFSLFKFEFALRQAQSLAIAEKQTAIEGALTVLAKRIKLAPFSDFGDYQTVLQKHFVPDKRKEAIFHKSILHLLYLFTPQRGFRDMENNAFKSLEEVGLFYARNQALFGHKTLQLEKAFFLNSINQYALHQLGYENFLFQVFSAEVSTHFDLTDVKLASDRSLVFKYKYYKALADFFESKEIDNQLIRTQTGNDTYTVKKGIFQGSNSIFNEFLTGVKRQHSIPDEVLDQTQTNQLKKEVKRALWRNGFLLYTGEWLAAIFLLIPFIGGAGLALIKNAEGVSLGQQLYSSFSLNHYVTDPETNFNTVEGFYFIFAFFFITYLFALIPRLWCGSKLNLFGKADAKAFDLLTLPTTAVAGTFLLMLFFPVIFSFSNWLLEPLGWVLLLIIGGALSFATGEKRARVLGLMVILATILRIVYMVQQGINVEVFPWQFNSRLNRGLIDVVLYTLMMSVALMPAIIYQLFKAHSTFYFGIKALILALVFGLTMVLNTGVGNIGAQNWVMTVPGYTPSSTFTEHEGLEEGTYIARLKANIHIANVRNGRSRRSTIVTRLNKGETFTVTKDPQNSWWLVKTQDGAIGYIYRELVELVNEQ